MKGDIREYARLGLVHHMLYPHSMKDGDEHVRTLAEFVKREDIETFDCCLPYGAKLREKLVPLVRDCGKSEVAFCIHVFPFDKFYLSSPIPHEQGQVRLIIQDIVDQAGMVGATGFVFGPGGPSAAVATEEHFAAFADFCRWLCGRLAVHGITAMLEPFDWLVDKKFLYGPTQSCVELAEQLQPECGNFGIELDMAHVPLMGESFEQAIKTVGPHLKRVHLGNCVLKDKSSPLYGDWHPPIGAPGGEIGVPEVTEILRLLLEIGYLDRDQRGNLLIEMKPMPGDTVEETVADCFARVEQAWQAV